jgi:hypothetical protein
MRCPSCDGAGSREAFVSFTDGTGAYKGVGCLRCRSSGVVPDEMAAWVVEGKKLLGRRQLAGLSLFEFGKSSGLGSAKVCTIESGRVDPQEYASLWP